MAAMAVSGGFMLLEIVGGVLSGSLALLADAGHMMTDVASMMLAWLGFHYSRRPADRVRTYGYRRLEVLAAFANGVFLVALVVWIAVEAVSRLLHPVAVASGPMLAIAVAGLLSNVVAFLILHRGSGENLNMRGAVAHVLGDLLGSLAAIAAALIIRETGWMAADPLLSLVAAAVMLRTALSIVRGAGHILLEGTPDGLDIEALRADLAAAVPDIDDVHHIHAWSLSAEHTLITLHATLRDGGDGGRALGAVKTRLIERFGITHSVVQLEPAGCVDRLAHERAALAPEQPEPISNR